MCDTLCVTNAGRTLFAKNSDRPLSEAQVAEWHAPRDAQGEVKTQYLSLPDERAYGFVGSRPDWLWGVEHGVNEHRVAIGNEKIWTIDDAHASPPALLGMDLVRLALERARTADEALGVVTTLLERHGQGGSGEQDHDEPYFSSFLIADPFGGWIVETSGRTWAARPTGAGAAISNRVTLRANWTAASPDVAPDTDFDLWRDPNTPTGIADHRLAATRATVAIPAAALGPRDLVATLRHHGDRPWGPPGSDGTDVSPPPPDVNDDWSGVTVCMHVRGYQATTASMVAELLAEREAALRVWLCLGSPCVGVYVPAFPPAVSPELSDTAQWRRFAALRDRVDSDPTELGDIRRALAPVEAELWHEADHCTTLDSRAALEKFARHAYAPVDAALAKLGV